MHSLSYLLQILDSPVTESEQEDSQSSDPGLGLGRTAPAAKSSGGDSGDDSDVIFIPETPVSRLES